MCKLKWEVDDVSNNNHNNILQMSGRINETHKMHNPNKISIIKRHDTQ